MRSRYATRKKFQNDPACRLTYHLDSSVAILVRDGDPDTLERLERLRGPVDISIVTRVELEGGVYRDPAHASLRRARLDRMLSLISVVPFDDACADAYRAIMRTNGYSRRRILDRMIAAQALSYGATLITGNGADFRDVRGLDLIEW